MAQKTEATSLIEYIFVRIFVFKVRCLPYRLAVRLGSGLGSLVFRLWGSRRALAKSNLAFVFPDKKPEEINRLAKTVFQNVGKTLIEFIYSEKWDKTQLLAQVEVEGRENADAALARGKGVILLAAHFGNWELLGMALSSLGYKVKVLARPLDNPRLDRLVNRIRSRFGEEIIANINSVKEVIKCLRRNEIVGILMDQNLYENAVFVDFFHKLAATTPVVPLLAQKTGTAIIPIHMIRQGNGKHKIVMEKELELKNNEDRRQFVEINTRLCNQVVENWISQYPEQWFWVHNRWKTRPSA